MLPLLIPRWTGELDEKLTKNSGALSKAESKAENIEAEATQMTSALESAGVVGSQPVG